MKFDQPTRHSLILRLHDTNNQAAWQEFVEIYQPMIFRIAGKLGLQKADAVDATQEVLMHLTKVVDRWSPGNGNGKTSFRGWLYRVARNVMIRWMQGHDLKAIGSGHEDVQSLINEIPDPDNGQWVDLEFQRQVFASVACRLESEFHQKTWQAFWRTVVQNQSIENVGHQLEMSAGAIYVARSRVMNRLRSEAKRMFEQRWSAVEQMDLTNSQTQLTSEFEQIKHSDQKSPSK